MAIRIRFSRINPDRLKPADAKKLVDEIIDVMESIRERMDEVGDALAKIDAETGQHLKDIKADFDKPSKSLTDFSRKVRNKINRAKRARR